jgi:hypothetical protein
VPLTPASPIGGDGPKDHPGLRSVPPRFTREGHDAAFQPAAELADATSWVDPTGGLETRPNLGASTGRLATLV